MKAEWGIYRYPILVYRLHAIRKHIYQKISDLDAFIAISDEPIPFEKNHDIRFSSIKPGAKWGKAYTCAWFHFKGKIPQQYRHSTVVCCVDIGGEGLVVNGHGEPVSAINSRITFMDYLQPTWDMRVIDIDENTWDSGVIDVWVDAGFNGKIIQPFGKARFKYAYLALSRDDVKDFYFDYLTLAFAYCACDDEPIKNNIKLLLDKSYAAVKNFLPHNVAEAKKIISKMHDLEQKSHEVFLTAVGQGHLDLAWLWPIRESKRKAVRTLINALQNSMQYPEFVFGASQPQMFEWIKQSQPVLYDAIKKAVNTGAIELQGGMWVECDTNIPCGESLVRQIYYGKKFFKEEFNCDVVTCWLPDAFGFNGNIPQILKKSGIDYFCTIKLAWNEINKFPYTTFNWVGIDGSSVIAHMPPEGDYTSGATPLCVKRIVENFLEKDIHNNALLVYGNGDGGGGPTQTHIELIKRQQKLQWLPQVHFGKSIDYFQRLDAIQHKLPAYHGELYLEKHQGTYTTQALSKYYNRRLECLLHDCEFLATYAYCNGFTYPHQFFETIWKEVLLYQFHDILPGSSVKRVYDESVQRYRLLAHELQTMINTIVDYLSESGGIACINTTPFTRTEYSKGDSSWYRCQMEGYSSAYMEPVDSHFSVAGGDSYIENELLRVEFAKEGHIISVFDKTHRKEICTDYLNKLVLYTDKFRFFNAWDIDSNYHQKRKRELKLIDYETHTDGPQVFRRNYFRHGKTTLTQDIILYAGKPYVEFSTECDYHETFTMLRADFVPSVYSDTVTCDIQFGNIARSTKNSTSIEKAQFEICAHKWVDVSDNDYGVSLINDCKYGHRVKDGIISLNLLRSPVYPDPYADRGRHTFRYALYPHKGRLQDSETIPLGYHFNYPPIVVKKEVNIKPLIIVDNKSIVIETIKKAENEDAIVIRMYECFGNDISTTFTTGFTYKEAYEADLLERIIKKIEGNTVHFTKFEIKTLLFRL
ncbi:MAG TPA: glycoside hydrolase family 38 C-terminal domain-containing protein [Spirochaetota bacterium]|nr:glycoside hydrolase family 38 C-terminal domain-containing protein [Spirochaetota bacterium]